MKNMFIVMSNYYIDDHRVDITYRAIANIVDAIRYLSLRKCHYYILKIYLASFYV